MTVQEKLAYLKGLMEGLNLDENKDEIKIFTAIINVLDEVSDSILDLEDSYENLSSQIDAIDEDLDMLEQDYYDDSDDDDDEYYEVVCPNCGDEICLDEETILKESINCPNCGELLEFDLECDCDCCNEEDIED